MALEPVSKRDPSLAALVITKLAVLAPSSIVDVVKYRRENPDPDNKTAGTKLSSAGPINNNQPDHSVFVVQTKKDESVGGEIVKGVAQGVGAGLGVGLSFWIYNKFVGTEAGEQKREDENVDLGGKVLFEG
jgi:hypothetical protein